MTKSEASVQYNDFKGTSAADFRIFLLLMISQKNLALTLPNSCLAGYHSTVVMILLYQYL